MSAAVTWILVDDKHPRFNEWRAFSNIKGSGSYIECFPKGVDPNLYASAACEDEAHDTKGREAAEKEYRSILQSHNKKVIEHNDKYGVLTDNIPYGRGIKKPGRLEKKGKVKAWM